MVDCWKPNMPIVRQEVRRLVLRHYMRSLRDVARSLSPCKWGSILYRIWHLAMRSDVEFAELYGGVFAIVWGVWFAMPWFGDNMSETMLPVWRTMMVLMDNAGWAAVFVGIGALQIAGLLCESFTVRRSASMLAVMVWMFVGVCVAHDEWRAIACPTALACAVGAALGYVKIGQSRILENPSRSKEFADGKPN